MAPLSGFVPRAPEEPALYIAGDIIWCSEVADVLARHRPRVVVVNAGVARFVAGDPITMSERDVAEVCATTPRPPSSPFTWRRPITASYPATA